VIPYASQDYLAGKSITEPADLLDYELIHSDSTLVNWNTWLSWYGVAHHNKNYYFSFDRSYMSIEAARMGMGIILESNLLADDYLSVSTSWSRYLPAIMGCVGRGAPFCVAPRE
jgi:DNA-binding transcriptional LysR family regulator